MILVDNEPDQSDAVYAAEADVLPSSLGRHFASIGEAKVWLNSITESRRFQKRYPDTDPIILRAQPGNQRASCGYRDGVWHIRLPRFYRHQLGLLHELSHVLAPGNHGREFCSVYLSLIREHIGVVAALDLQTLFLFGGVKHRRTCKPESSIDDMLGFDWNF